MKTNVGADRTWCAIGIKDGTIDEKDFKFES